MKFQISRPKHSTVVAYVALVVAMSGTAAAATGGTFILGRSNSASTQSIMTNTGTGPVLALSTRTGQVPLAVSAQSGKATNLNADKLDGLDSTLLQRRTNAACGTGQAVTAISAGGVVTCKPTGGAFTVHKAGGAEGQKVAVAFCPPGRYATGGGGQVLYTAGNSAAMANSHPVVRNGDNYLTAGEGVQAEGWYAERAEYSGGVTVIAFVICAP